MSKPCSVEGCREPHRGKGFCKLHYNRWYRHGDPLYIAPPPVHIKAQGIEFHLQKLRRKPGASLIAKLIDRREQLGISQEKLAKIIGYSWGALTNWEKGHKQPVFGALINWTQALGFNLTLEDLHVETLAQPTGDNRVALPGGGSDSGVGSSGPREEHRVLPRCDEAQPESR